MCLARAPLRTLVRITNIHTENPMSLRLMEMGLIAGTEVEVVRRAPLGDPLHVRLGDCDLSLRSSEAELVQVTRS